MLLPWKNADAAETAAAAALGAATDVFAASFFASSAARCAASLKAPLNAGVTFVGRNNSGFVGPDVAPDAAKPALRWNSTRE